MRGFEDILAFQVAYSLSLDIMEISKGFPKEETYSLTDQMRRSSRSVCAQIGEAYGRRKYKNHFLSTLTIADSENYETQVWLKYALDFGYINSIQHRSLMEKSIRAGKLIGGMQKNVDKFLLR